VSIDEDPVGESFDPTVNDPLREAPGPRPFMIRPMSMGIRPELNYDKIEALIEYAEGPWHR
jgi:hypothetical protein